MNTRSYIQGRGYVEGLGFDIHSLIGKLPHPKKGWTLPNHKYTGPWNPLEQQLDENDKPLPGQEPYNQVDEIAMRHDICYRDHEDDKHGCDRIMIDELTNIKPKNLRERFDRTLVKGIIGTKLKLGLGEPFEELAEELHKPIKRKFQRRHVDVLEIDDVWGCDLVDMREWEKQNKGYKYMLNVIDVFSKFAWSIPMKDKTGKTTLEAFQTIAKESDRIPKHIWVDKGLEFYNKDVTKWLEDNSITRYSTFSEHKSVVVERFNRTLKEMMWKRFTAQNTRNWIEMLDDLMEKYNNRIHSTIGMSPVKASLKENEMKVIENITSKTRSIPRRKAKYKIGDKVRISRTKSTFEKGFLPNWSEEIYIIEKVQKTMPITYKLKDLLGIELEGSFYEQELQKASQEVYRIEKVIRKKKINGIDHALVKWSGYNEKHNSWIPVKDLTKV